MRLLRWLRRREKTAIFANILALCAEMTIELPAGVKRLVVFVVDICICYVSTWVAYYLRLGEFISLERLTLPVLLSILIAIPIFLVFGLYRVIFRYAGWSAIKAVAIAVTVYTLLYAPAVMVYTLDGVPRTIGILQPLILFFGVAGSRLLARAWLGGSYLSRLAETRRPQALIYGAGTAGQQLAVALRTSSNINVIGMVDDDQSLHDRVLGGIRIFSPDAVDEVILKKHVTHLFLAMPSASRAHRHKIINQVSRHQLVIRTLPSLTDLADGKVTVNDIKELEVDDLLEREPVDIDSDQYAGKINGRSVMVTGAGGSIGSELCRQIIDSQPRLLILIEFNEYALYLIHAELERRHLLSQFEPPTRVVPILCSVQDRQQLQQVIERWKPEAIYHAAAFKHVPLVESNIIEAFKNNVLGTLNLAQLALDNEVQDFVLVSTDKAVRPTNVMGATKRLAEMILQALSANNQSVTCLSMVRFGNVLASSGSVIPKFKEQLAAGGPITVTHPEVTRYFMTIPEAARLVLQAAAMAKGGEVFLLDMGDPIKIVDLAKRMITLSGLSERNADNPEGDIEIKFIGLRPGEKLYEELLIGNDPESTMCKKIMKGQERWLPWTDLCIVLEEAKKFAKTDDVRGLLNILTSVVDGFSIGESRGVD